MIGNVTAYIGHIENIKYIIPLCLLQAPAHCRVLLIVLWFCLVSLSAEAQAVSRGARTTSVLIAPHSKEDKGENRESRLGIQCYSCAHVHADKIPWCNLKLLPERFWPRECCSDPVQEAAFGILVPTLLFPCSTSLAGWRIYFDFSLPKGLKLWRMRTVSGSEAVRPYLSLF